jgi:hypothetical protein
MPPATTTTTTATTATSAPLVLRQPKQASGLFLFPTKALAQDQLRSLRSLLADAFGDAAPCAEVRARVFVRACA